jgi:hypothetical protein
MNVVTENPIIYIGANDTYEADIFLPLDGKSSSAEIKAFQSWANGKYKTNLTVDGKLGRNTKSAFNKYGSEWNRVKIIQGIDPKKNLAPPTVIPAVNPSPTQIEEAKKKGFNWDKARGVFIKAQELGIVDALLGKLGITPRTPNELPEVGADTGLLPPDAPSQGMSTTTKVLIGVGIVGVLGLILYSAKSKSK